MSKIKGIKAKRYLDHDNMDVIVALEYRSGDEVKKRYRNGCLDDNKYNNVIGEFESYIRAELGIDMQQCNSDSESERSEFWEFFDYDDSGWIEVKTKITFDL